MSSYVTALESTNSDLPVEHDCPVVSNLSDNSQSKETDLFKCLVDKRKLAKIKPIMVHQMINGQNKMNTVETIINTSHDNKIVEKNFSSDAESFHLQSMNTITRPEQICLDKDDDSLSSSLSSNSHSMQSVTTNGSLSLLSLATQSIIGGSDAYAQPTENDSDMDQDYFVVHNICDFGLSDEEDNHTENDIKCEEKKSDPIVEYFINGIVKNNQKEESTLNLDVNIENIENFPIHNNWHLDTIPEEEEEVLSANTITTIDDLTENFDQDAIISLSSLSNIIFKNDNDDDTVTLATDVVDSLDFSIEINNTIKNQKDSGIETELSTVENIEG